MKRGVSPALLTVRNLRRHWPVDTRLLRSIGKAAIEALRLSDDAPTPRPATAVAAFLVSARRVAFLNERFLGHAGPTDVITFDYGEPSHEPSPRSRRREEADSSLSASSRRRLRFMAGEQVRKKQGALHAPPGRVPAANRGLHGDIFICLDEARRQARAFGTTWEAEVVRYLVHGLLHLCGHDDLEPDARRRMKRVENRLVRRLAVGFAFKRLRKGPMLLT